MKMLDHLRAGLDRIDRALTALACVGILAIMFIVGADVLCRYVLGAPSPWAYDLISIFLINAIFYFTLSEALRTRHHLGLDLQMPQPWQPAVRVLAWLGGLLVLAVVCAFAWVMLQAAWESWRTGERVPGQFEWIVWIKFAIVAVGAVMLAVRISLMLLSGRDQQLAMSQPAAEKVAP